MAAAAAQPVIGSVQNAASNALAPSDANGKPIGNNIIAQGSLFSVYGTGLGPASLVGASSLPLPTALPDANGTSIAITSGGQSYSAYLVYVSATQAAAIIPSTVPIGPATVSVSNNGKTSAPFPISVTKTGLGVFTRNSQGNGPGVIQIARGTNALSVNALTNSAQPGDTLIIYASGLGAVSVPDNDVPGPVPAGSSVTVNIAGTVLPATYAGRAPTIPGVDQINVQLPSSGLPTGCYIPAEITASGQPSNLFYLSIASGTSNCTHPLGLGPDALAALDAGGTANVGVFNLLRAVVLGVPAEGAGGVFDNVNANSAFQLTNLILNSFGALNYPVASGSCAVLDSYDPGASFSVPNLSTVGGKELNAGPGLNLAGSNGNSQGILHVDTGGYLGVFFATLGSGSWTLSGSGGPDVNSFNAKTNLPENLIWTNAGNFTTVPKGDITITWTGGNLNPNAQVTVSGSSVVINPTDPSKSRGRQFFCNAPASAGKTVIPASVLAQMPSSTADASAGEVAFGTLGINAGGGSSFTAPLVSGKLDAGWLAYGEAQTQQVKYQ